LPAELNQRIPAAAARSTARAAGDVPSKGPSMKLFEWTTMSGRREIRASVAATKSASEW
jgi:hypothetical protein